MFTAPNTEIKLTTHYRYPPLSSLGFVVSRLYNNLADEWLIIIHLKKIIYEVIRYWASDKLRWRKKEYSWILWKTDVFCNCPQMLFLCSSISIVSLLSPREWTSPEKMRSVPVLVISPRSHTTNRIIGGTKKGSGLESKKIFVREACPWISSSHKLSCAWKTLPSVWSRTVQSSTTVPTTKPQCHIIKSLHACRHVDMYFRNLIKTN